MADDKLQKKLLKVSDPPRPGEKRRRRPGMGRMPGLLDGMGMVCKGHFI